MIFDNKKKTRFKDIGLYDESVMCDYFLRGNFPQQFRVCYRDKDAFTDLTSSKIRK